VRAIKDLAKKGMRFKHPLLNHWQKDRVLISAKIEILAGELVDLKDVDLRCDLAFELADLELGIDYLDMDVVQGSQRAVTQAVARALFDRGAAGVLYKSRLDDEPCIALFEGRASLVPAGEVIPMTESPPELQQVCREFRLDLPSTP
jgi:hypothetical protein